MENGFKNHLTFKFTIMKTLFDLTRFDKADGREFDINFRINFRSYFIYSYRNHMFVYRKDITRSSIYTF